MTQLGDALKLRSALGSDLNFIFDTFRESMRMDSSLGRSCKASIFKREFNRVIDHLLEKAKTTIACMVEDENVILGYLIWEPSIIHYCFVKRAFRGMGIAKELVQSSNLSSDIQCAFKTRSSKEIFNKYPSLIHNPLLNFKKGVFTNVQD